jgi:protein involved in polysaccharide export with SLBB domain|tara:strand:- start:1033 stop:2220 length:1188 start_codon:yes stop_codon:yes gene_type:complete
MIIIIIPWVSYAQTFGRMELGPSEGEEESVFPETESVPLEKPVSADEYVVGPGDKLTINILTSESLTIPLVVTPTGALIIPSVGVLPVAGDTLNQVVNKVRDFVKEQAYPNAKVTLALTELRTFLVQVIGAVGQPGFIEITPAIRMGDLVEFAGGFHQLAREFDITVLSNTGEEHKIDFLQFILYGDLGHNPTFQEGDKLIIPFGDVEKEGVVIRGALSGRGYDIIAPSETLEHFLWRKAQFLESADLESVTITRLKNGKEEFLNVRPEHFSLTMLKPGDTIDILRERGISVNGFVQTPGSFEFFPGFTAADYINLAGGNTAEGSPNRVLIRHLDGSKDRGQDVLVRRGDVIVVPRNLNSSIFGESSLMQIGTALLTVYLTYLATQANDQAQTPQ